MNLFALIIDFFSSAIEAVSSILSIITDVLPTFTSITSFMPFFIQVPSALALIIGVIKLILGRQ